MTMGQFVMYQPYVHQEVKTGKEYMVLDATTMENLNLLGITGSIQKTLDLCCTSFGKRLVICKKGVIIYTRFFSIYCEQSKKPIMSPSCYI